MSLTISKRNLLDKSLFIYFSLNIIFCVTFYGFIESQLRFTYSDEIIYLGLLFVWAGLLYNSYSVYIFLSVLLFYLIYSFYIHSNIGSALMKDLLIQSKPFMTFFICYAAAPRFTNYQKKVFRVLCLAMYVFLLAIGGLAVLSGNVVLFMFTHFTDTGSAFSSAVIIVSVFYLLNSKFKTKDKAVFILMIMLAFISAKSRFYGYFAASCFLMLYGKRIKTKLTVKSVLIGSVIFGLILIVAWKKIQANFIVSTDEDTSARLTLYEKSFLIFKNYFPFGSGYASYGTEASRSYYSKTYDQYGLSSIWGLSRSNDSFITDTYLPSLAEFGVFGVILFIIFWWYIIRIFNKQKILNRRINKNFNVIFLLVIIYLAIESIANDILTSSSGMATMAILALIISEKRNFKNTEKNVLYKLSQQNIQYRL